MARSGCIKIPHRDTQRRYRDMPWSRLGHTLIAIGIHQGLNWDTPGSRLGHTLVSAGTHLGLDWDTPRSVGTRPGKDCHG